jgi:WD40 repeat protein/tRNA A-37 threonylcarbamoyl transferase component Bud32
MSNEPSKSIREQQLQEILVAYLEAVEKGLVPNQNELLARHPEFAAELAEFLNNRAEMDRLAGSLKPAGRVPVAPGDAPTLAPAAAPGIGTLGSVPYFGDYELLEEIARGGMGVVFKARQVSLNRIVALKMILARHLATPVDIERFRTEAQAAGNLDHPHIVPIYEVGDCQGQQYYSMKLVDGGNLSQQVQHLVQQPRRAAEIVAAVARAVHHAHQRGILHRDLKPGNVLLDSRGTPHVSDFGLAKRVSADSRLTNTGAIVGTPSYMAPEQARAEKGITIAADVYSLGAILYELLTGRPPFRAITPMETLFQVIEREPEPPRRVGPEVPRDLETICLKCLHKEPAKRYGSAEALADDLDRWLRGEPITARPTGRVERVALWMKRRPAAAALLAVSLFAALVLVAISVFFTIQVKRQRDMAMAEREAALAARQQALIEADRAERARDEAEQAKQQELQQRQNAVDAQALADRRREEAERQLYVNQIALADRCWAANNSARAEQVLDGCIERLRNWEWYYLSRLFHPDWRTLQGDHVAFHPEGKLLATISPEAAQPRDEVVKLWDVQTGQERDKLPVDVQSLFHLAFNTDGSRLAVACGDKTVRVWDVAARKELHKLQGHTGTPTCVAFSPDGKRLASASVVGNRVQGGHQPDEVRVWDLATGKEVLRVEKAGRCVAFSPDGTRLAALANVPAGLLSPPGYFLGVWDSGTGKQVWQTTWTTGNGPDDDQVAFTPDGKLVASLRGEVVKLWDTASGKEVRSLRGHSQRVRCLAFTPDGKQLATAGRDETVRLWDVASGKELIVHRGHTGDIGELAFSPDGQRLASATAQQTIRIWNVRTSQGPRELELRLHPNFPWAISPDQKTLLARRQDLGPLSSIGLYDAESSREIRKLRSFTFPGGIIYNNVAWSPDGKRVAAEVEPNIIEVWTVETGAALATLKGHTDRITEALVFSPDGARLASAGRDGTVRVWDLAAGRELDGFAAKPFAATRLAFSPDGKRLAATGPAVVAWDLHTSKEVLKLPHVGRALAFSTDGRHLACDVFSDNTIRIHDARTGIETAVLRGHNADVRAICFSPDGQRLASAGWDAVRLWNPETGQELLTFPADRARRIAFSPDGRQLVAEAMLKVYVWDARPRDRR